MSIKIQLAVKWVSEKTMIKKVNDSCLMKYKSVHECDIIEVKCFKRFYSNLFRLHTKSGQSEDGRKCSGAKSIVKSVPMCNQKRQAELVMILLFASRRCILTKILCWWLLKTLLADDLADHCFCSAFGDK